MQPRGDMVPNMHSGSLRSAFRVPSAPLNYQVHPSISRGAIGTIGVQLV